MPTIYHPGRLLKIVFLDSTALPGIVRGPGSPAYFSRYLIAHLTSLGHDVVMAAEFDPALCSVADLVITEWVNEEAYRAADSGVCKRLVLRMRGYDAHGPLDRMKWDNVDALVYESPFLKELAEEKHPPLASFNAHVLPSGVDLANIPFADRTVGMEKGDVVALVARTTSDKGYQLAFEWARTRDVELHVTGALGETNPRLVRYLQHSAPPNVKVYGTVSTIEWLGEIGANFLLSASIWESLGYSIAEAMAMGIKPLIHDAPGITKFWPSYLTWRTFSDLDWLMTSPYDSASYRFFIEQNLDAAKLSAAFAQLVLTLPARDTSPSIELSQRATYDHTNRVFHAVRSAIERPSNLQAIDTLVTDYRSRLEAHSLSSSVRYGIAMATAVAHFNHGDYPGAELWAARAMLDFSRPDAMCLMGECADARDDIEEAVQWYKAACAIEDVPDRYRFPQLVNARFDRLSELEKRAELVLPPDDPPEHYTVVVTVRNGEKWIERCLRSIQNQTVRDWDCIVVDDCSTDRTADIAVMTAVGDRRFSVHQNHVRRFQAYNTMWAARLADPDDVVILIDGDDWLLHDRAFEVIRDAYVKGAWMTYGCLVEAKGDPTRFGYYPQRIARESRFREWVWCATPPRTFKRFLIDQLKDEDFMVEGKWPEMAGDVAIYTPIMELAAERAVGIREPIYVYNTDTPDNEHKIDPFETTRIRDLLLRREPKKRLDRP